MRRTPIAESRRSSDRRLTTSVASALAILASHPALAVAQPAGPADPSSPASPEAVADAPLDSSPTPPLTVSIVVVGERLSTSELSSALGAEPRSDFALGFSRAESFGPQDLFRARVDSSTDIHVWVDTTTPGVVRLYFANRAGTRYLVRTMELSDQMDEMDREALAQAMEWSLSALAQGTAGLTREQAESLLTPPSSEPVPTTPPPTTESEPVPRTPPWRRRGKGWLPEIASFYRTSGHSTSFPILHGPGLRIGADQISQHRQLGIAASAQYQFPQRYEDARVALELRTLALRLDLRAIDTDLVAHNGLGAVIGVGLDTIWLSPQTRDSIAFAAEANRVSLAPLLTGGLIWQIRLNAAVRIELGVGMEVDLVPTHYDIVEPAGTERFVSRWPARPAASLGVEFL